VKRTFFSNDVRFRRIGNPADRWRDTPAASPRRASPRETGAPTVTKENSAAVYNEGMAAKPSAVEILSRLILDGEEILRRQPVSSSAFDEWYSTVRGSIEFIYGADSETYRRLFRTGGVASVLINSTEAERAAKRADDLDTVLAKLRGCLKTATITAGPPAQPTHSSGAANGEQRELAAVQPRDQPNQRRRAMPEYDIALSFAGEDREIVEPIAEAIKSRGLRVFYDQYETATLWGKNLFRHFSDVYENRAIFCVVFVSRHYAEKSWTNHELKNAQARAIREKGEYILPIRLDDTELPGLSHTVHYLTLEGMTPSVVADLVSAKVAAHAAALQGDQAGLPAQSSADDARRDGAWDVIARMQRELDEFRRIIGPRTLADDARKTLQHDLAALKVEDTAILAPEADEEGQEFAATLRDVFHAAGWLVDVQTAVHPSTVIGVQVVIPGTWPKPQVPHVADEIAAALNKAGVQTNVGHLHEVSSYRFFISVGKKPRGS
jgi:hypothetical protein